MGICIADSIGRIVCADVFLWRNAVCSGGAGDAFHRGYGVPMRRAAARLKPKAKACGARL